jgi:hypothetical protein
MSSEPNLLQTVTAWIPILGGVTGILGLVISIVNYRRVSHIKALDMRLDLRRKSSDYLDLVKTLPAHLEHANQSRIRVSAALGLSGSGIMVVWQREFDSDRAKADELMLTSAQFAGDFKTLSRDELEARLIELHSLDGRARRMKEKYAASIATDDRDRTFIRDNVHANFRAELLAPHVQGKKKLGE